MTDLFKVLADETRLRCLVLIFKHQELCVCELIYALALPQPTISRHLSILKLHKLLKQRRLGQWMLYSLHPDLSTFQRAVLDLIASEAQRKTPFTKDETTLMAMSDRPAIDGQCCDV